MTQLVDCAMTKRKKKDTENIKISNINVRNDYKCNEHMAPVILDTVALQRNDL